MNTESYSIIEDVRSGIDSRNQAIANIYTDEKLLASVTSYVLKNGGQHADVDDVFIFGIMAFVKQCARAEFILNGTVNSYVFSVIRYEWLRRKKEISKVTYDDQEYFDGEEVSIEHLIIKEEERIVLRNALNQMESKCKEILTMWASNFKMREIATNSGYKSDGMARKKKHECLSKLKSLLKDINDGK